MKHTVNHGNVDPCFADSGQVFVVFAQATILAQPSESALHQPPFGQYDKGGAVATADNFSLHLEELLTLMKQGRTLIAAIQQQLFPAPKQGHPSEQVSCAIDIRPVGRMDEDAHQPTLAIHDDMALASLHFLAPIIAARPPFSVVLTD